MDGLTEVKAKLLADSSVVAGVGEYAGVPAIYGIPILPATYTYPALNDQAISMYVSVPVSGGLEYGSSTITVNSFGKKRSGVVSNQALIFEALNRRSYGQDAYFVCSKLPVIPPQNTGGDYNAPVEVQTKRRG